jgi:peptidoglycan/LPS O-acetylase OafA/YrhL
MSIQKFGWVNAIRGYAILFVMMIHVAQHCELNKFLRGITQQGDMGVPLFFIISAFTIFNSYKKRVSSDGPHHIIDFYIRRFFRIVPYYYFAGALYVFVLVFLKNEKIKWGFLLCNYLFINGLYIPSLNYIPPGSWSIGTEMLFYGCVPILISVVRSLQGAVIFFVCSIMFSLILWGCIFINYKESGKLDIFTQLAGQDLYFWLPNQMPFFAAGIIIYYLFNEKKITTQTGCICIFASIIAFLILSQISFSFYTLFGPVIRREYFMALVFMSFIIGTYTLNNSMICNFKIQKIGIVSFSMYLNHFFVILALEFIFVHIFGGKGLDRIKGTAGGIAFLFYYMAVILITYSISKYTYKYIEKNGIMLGEKIINRYFGKISSL